MDEDGIAGTIENIPEYLLAPSQLFYEFMHPGGH
jgi:hypothetical protein